RRKRPHDRGLFGARGKGFAAMIRAFQSKSGRLDEMEASDTALASALWIDVEAPSPEEAARVAGVLRVEVPSREDMEEIEPSSRVYHAEEVVYLTAQVLASRDMKRYEIGPVTF